MDTIKDRIAYLIELYDKGEKQLFAKRINVSKATITRVVTLGKPAGGKVLTNILTYCPEVRAEWLMRGVAPPLVSKNEPGGTKEPDPTYDTRSKEYIANRMIEQIGHMQSIIDKLQDDTEALEEED